MRVIRNQRDPRVRSDVRRAFSKAKYIPWQLVALQDNAGKPGLDAQGESGLFADGRHSILAVTVEVFFSNDVQWLG